MKKQNYNQISGPINLIRLEGKINNTNKVFYIFMDLHVDPNYQTECSDIRNIHIRNYIINTLDDLKNTNQVIDFFLETFPDYSTYKSSKTSIYLNQLRDMFEKIFKFDFQKNKVVKSTEFPNIRLHYMDIRPYFTFSMGDPFGMINEITDYIFSNNNITPRFIINILDSMTILNSQLKIIYDSFFGDQKIVKSNIIREYPNKYIKYDDKNTTQTINYVTNKIKNVYANDDIKKKINNIISIELAQLFNDYIEHYAQLDKILNDSIKLVNHGIYERVKHKGNFEYFYIAHGLISDDIMNKINVVFDKYRLNIIHIYILIMDLYFMRRSLDKSYVSNIVSYTGAYHSANYIKILIKYFGFKITHVYYSEIKDLTKLNSKIKNLTNTFNVLDLFKPEVLNQCIDISKFPKDFE